ncbi:MAG TPA: molybdopterin molybdotransferase MoeA, partial [Mucilaginibacter sp.]|nr:molybdopterin molybdotransferase MoeA [Mucilaginibacter sp.]
MITIEQAEKLILAEARDFGTETIPFSQALGRVLAEDIVADRDLPPFDRVMMDGIAITYSAIEQGVSSFRVTGTQAAGDEPVDIKNPDECIEIMTGAALPGTADTVVRYEDTEIKNGIARLLVTSIQKGQSLHLQGADRKKGDVVIPSGRVISPTLINTIASAGKTLLLVKKLPRVVIISSGDELVDIDEQPSPIQIRKSNSYTIQAILSQHRIQADLLHIPDDEAVTREKIRHGLANYDVILMTGGISMG